MNDDRFLIQRMQSGDYEAFTSLYHKYVRQLTQYGRKFMADLPAIEDCLHDVFVWLWTNRKDLEIRHSVKSYLFKAVRTSMLHTVKRKNRFTAIGPGEENEYHFELELSPESLALQNEDRRLIREKIQNVLNTLTAKQKEVIYLRYYEGLGFEDIARNMDLSVKASYKLMGRAIATLRENFPQSWIFF